MSVEIERFQKFLELLIAGDCTAELWDDAAVCHYSSPLVESCRVQLVRQSLTHDGWDFRAPPSAIFQLALALREELISRGESNL
jgi:hypothetical protein